MIYFDTSVLAAYYTVEAVFEIFAEHLRERFHRVSLDRKLVALTREVAAGSNVRTLDALLLVTALHLKLPLATFDRRLAAAARAAGLQALP